MIPELNHVAHGRVDARLDALLSSLDALLSSLDERLERCERVRGPSGERVLLLNLWVAASQLRKADDLARARATILDIVISLVGCEQLGLFELVGLGSRERYEPRCWLGLSEERKHNLVPGCGWIGERIASAESFVSDAGPLQMQGADAHGLSACLPLSNGERTVAVLLLYGLVEHKPRLNALDHHLLALLHVHAGAVLAAARRWEQHRERDVSGQWSRS